MKWHVNVPFIQKLRTTKIKTKIKDGNAMSTVDLHVHSNKSDGTYSPTELVDYAISKGLSAFALTDHDTTAGLDEIISYASSLPGTPIEIIPGIEFSTEYEGQDIHILGLFIDYKRPSFASKLQAFVDSRILRNQKMCALLSKAGIDITYEKLLAMFPGAVITRAHYAKYLLQTGVIKSMQEAFERYIGDHCPYFVPREKVTPVAAVQLILEADGIPILAHPTLYHMGKAKLDTLVATLKEAGLLGIEALYSTYTPAETRYIHNLAAKYNLLISGGSDFHGSIKPGLDLGVGYGKLFIPEEILSTMKKSQRKLLFSDMDGTLLNAESQISPAMNAGIDRMSQLGHQLILTSGRPLDSILEVVRATNLDKEPGLCIIANNGACIYDVDKDSYIIEYRLSKTDMRYIISEAKKFGIYCHAYTDTHIVSSCESKELAFYRQRIHLPYIISEDIVSSLEKGSYKLLAIDLNDKEKLIAFRDHIAPYCEGKIQCVFSNDRFLEIFPIHAGKGNALRYLCEYFHVPISHSYAAGDADNDISMIQAAGTGIAMQNATDNVKATADIITTNDNAHDGLLTLINSL